MFPPPDIGFFAQVVPVADQEHGIECLKELPVGQNLQERVPYGFFFSMIF